MSEGQFGGSGRAFPWDLLASSREPAGLEIVLPAD